MAAYEQAGENAVDDLVMTDNDAADLLAHGRITRDELLGLALDRFPTAHVLFLGGAADGIDATNEMPQPYSTQLTRSRGVSHQAR